MVIFQQLYLVGKAEGRVHFHLVIGLVLAVAPFGRGLAKTHRRQAVAVRQLFHIVLNALLVKEIFFLFALGCLVAELERDARVHHGLPLDGVQIIFHRHIDVGEHLTVGLPAGFAARRRLFMQTAHGFTLLKIQVIMKAVAPDIRLHPLGRILRGAQAKAVQAQRVLVAFLPGRVFAARVQLAEQKFPVIAVFLLVKIHRHAAAEIFYLHRTVRKARDENAVAIALARFVDGVGKNLENRVGAPVHTVRTENDARALAHTVCPFQHGDALVCIGCVLFRHGLLRMRYFHESAARTRGSPLRRAAVHVSKKRKSAYTPRGGVRQFAPAALASCVGSTCMDASYMGRWGTLRRCASCTAAASMALSAPHSVHMRLPRPAL